MEILFNAIHQIILLIFYLILIIVAVKLGIYFRKQKNAKQE